MDALNRRVLPVVNETRLAGLVTRRDLASARARLGALIVGGLMRGDFAHVQAEADLWRAQPFMLGTGIRAAFAGAPWLSLGQTRNNSFL